ncbi:MAG: sensor histidine kinase [Bacteroidales bacterium]|nr:sensor histidine kinase [Bacteroidales bacterium]
MNKSIRLILFLFLILQGTAYAQNITVDSLIDLNQTLQNEKKVNNLINISRQYFIDGDDRAENYAWEAISLSNQINFEEGKGKAYLFLALCMDNINVDSSLKYYSLSGEILSKINHPWAGYAFENSADKFRIRGWYPEALHHYLLALEVYQTSKDTTQICKTISGIGYIYNAMGDNATAIEWQKKALFLASNIDVPSLQGLIYGRIGIAYDEMSIFDSAHYYNQMAIRLFRKSNEYNYLSRWLSNIGNTYVQQSNYIEAEKYLLEALTYIDDESIKTSSYTNLANIYINTNRYREAKLLLDSALYFAHKFKQKDFQAEVYFRNHELYSKLGQYKKSLKYYNDYSKLKDSILNAENTTQIANMRVRYETEQKENQLLTEIANRDRLEKENALAEIVISNRNRLIIIILSTGIAAIFLLMFIYQRKKSNLKAEQDAAIIRERESGIKAIFEAQEEERSRIAKDLHDGIGQQISAIKLHFQNMASDILEVDPKLRENLSKMISMIRDVGDETRSISHQMMPKSLTQLGLVDALQDMIDKSFTGTSISYRFEHYNLEVRLPQNIETGLYRIAQELIVNIIKHSKATQVDIQLMKIENNCIFIVQDNGQGMQNAGKKEGIGIMNITNRIRTMNGELNIESNQHNGTTATIKIYLG